MGGMLLKRKGNWIVERRGMSIKDERLPANLLFVVFQSFFFIDCHNNPPCLFLFGLDGDTGPLKKNFNQL